MFSTFLADVRYSLRGFLKRPGFALIVIATLAVGVGVNAAIYTVFELVLTRPLPVQDPDSLVNLAAPGPKYGSTSCNIAGDCTEVFSYPMFRDLERLQEPFVGIAAHRRIEANLAFEGRARDGDAMFVSGRYFELLGIQPVLGRLLSPEDDRVDGVADSVVLGHAYWRDNLGADPGVLGKTLVVNGSPLTIVGVAPRGFFGTSKGTVPEVYVPITFSWLDRPFALPDHEDRRRYWTYLFARLKPGVTAEQAAVAINAPYAAILNDVEAALQTDMSEQTLAQFRTKQIAVTPGARGQSFVDDGAELPLALLLLTTSTVLLIACVNIANLMLARGAQRLGEMAVRSSMGAATVQLARLVLTESALLALAAAALSLPVTLGMLHAVSAILPAFLTDSLVPTVDGRIAAFATLSALACAAIFSLFPVLKLARAQPADVLRAHGARTTKSRAADRFRTGLVTAQIALSMALLVLAGLLTQSLTNILRVDLGMRTDSVLAFTLSPELNGYPPDRSKELFDRVEEELRALPGVAAVASSSLRLLDNSEWNQNVEVEGYTADPDAQNTAELNFVGPGFFQALGIPLLAGREFTEADADGRPGVAIVNRPFLERFGLNADALGKRVGMFGSGLTIEIVGIVGDAKYDTVKDPIGPQIFSPRRQAGTLGSMTYYVRSDAPQAMLAANIRQMVARLDPTLPVTDPRDMDRQIRDNVFLDRFTGLLAGGMAVLATLLAALGLYGVLSYTLAQRTAELGLRMALGAAPARLRGMVLRQVGRMGVVGGILGLAAALLLGQVAGSLLFGVQATDVRVLSGAAGVLAIVVLTASYLPARRASRVDPMVALRSE